MILRTLYTLLAIVLFPLVSLAAEGYVIAFSFSAEDASGKIIYNEKGNLSVSGGKYRLVMDDEFAIVSNGSVQWIYNPANEDIVISQSELSGQLSKASDSEDVVRSLVSILSSSQGTGSKAEFIEGKAKNIVGAVLRQGKSVYRIKVESLSTSTSLDEGLFVINPDDYPDAFVTDLR